MPDQYYIAIVDDHAMFRKGLESLVNLMPGYKVLLEVGNGKELVEKLKPNSLPHIVLLDITMPHMDGYATAKWLTVNYPEVKILALSTLDSEAAIIKMIRCGAKGYILKDADPSELKTAFKELMTTGYYYNESITRKVMQSINKLDDHSNDVHTLSALTEKELEFIRHSCSEKTYKQIAAEMFLSERTIDGYRESVFKKLNAASRVGIVMFAIKNGLVKL